MHVKTVDFVAIATWDDLRKSSWTSWLWFVSPGRERAFIPTFLGTCIWIRVISQHGIREVSDFGSRGQLSCPKRPICLSRNWTSNNLTLSQHSFLTHLSKDALVVGSRILAALCFVLFCLRQLVHTFQYGLVVLIRRDKRCREARPTPIAGQLRPLCPAFLSAAGSCRSDRQARCLAIQAKNPSQHHVQCCPDFARCQIHQREHHQRLCGSSIPPHLLVPGGRHILRGNKMGQKRPVRIWWSMGILARVLVLCRHRQWYVRELVVE